LRAGLRFGLLEREGMRGRPFDARTPDPAGSHLTRPCSPGQQPGQQFGLLDRVV
jgi:hypothetical protein